MYKAPPPPEGCEDSDQTERKLIALADLLEKKARKVLESDAEIGLGTAKELALAAIRARRQAAELAIRREDRSYSTWVVDTYRELAGGQAPPTRPGGKKR